MQTTKKCAEGSCDNPVFRKIVLVGAGGGGDFQGVLALGVASFDVYAARNKKATGRAPGIRKYYPVTAGYFWDGYEKAVLNNVDPKKQRKPSASRPQLTAGEAKSWFEALQIETDVLQRGDAFEVPGVGFEMFTNGLDDGLLDKLAPNEEERAAKIGQLQKSLASADFVYCSLAAESLDTKRFRDQYQQYKEIITNPYMTPTTETGGEPMKAALAGYLSDTVGNEDGGFEARVFDVGSDITSPDRNGRDVQVRLALEQLFKEGKIEGFKSLQIHVAGAGVDAHTTPAKALQNLYDWAEKNKAEVTTDNELGESLCTVLQEAKFAENVRESRRANGNYMRAREIYKRLKSKDMSDDEAQALKQDYLQHYLLQRPESVKEPQKKIDITAEFDEADDLAKVTDLFQGLAAYYVIQFPLKKERVPDDAAPQAKPAVSGSLTISSRESDP